MKKNIYKKILLYSLLSSFLVGCSKLKDEEVNQILNYQNYSQEFLDENTSTLKDAKQGFNKEDLLQENYNIKDYNKLNGYVSGKTTIKEKDNNEYKSIKTVKSYEKIKILKKCENGYYLIEYKNIKGYIKGSKLKKLPSKYIEIDISNQSLKLYEKNKLVLKTKVVTGLASDKERKTPVGYYKVYYKEKDATLNGENYSSDVDYWMPFYHNYGLHDASWRNEFGKKIYKLNGSHGCVNMPREKAKKLYNKVEVGTKVLIHK